VFRRGLGSIFGELEGMLKKCPSCQEQKDLSDFYKCKSEYDGHTSSCKLCVKARAKRWRENNPDKARTSARKSNAKRYTKAARRERYLTSLATEQKVKAVQKRHRLKTYGMTQTEYALLLRKQGGVCGICKNKRKLHVDHCHATGKVRGLLCAGCNTALGRFGDNNKGVWNALSYLASAKVGVRP
jgi:Recombination endonuclease VII